MWTWIVAVVLVAAAYWYFTRSSTPSKPITLQPLVVKPTSDAAATRSSSTTLKKRAVSGPPMKILFGSQTGTAEDFALELSNEAIAHQFAAEVQDLESYVQDDPETLADEPGVVAFVVSTYGDGEPTDNAKDFMAWLLDDAREPGMLSKLKYIIFGLGNKTYEQYNATARKLDQRLLELGAKRIFERGEGDEDSTLEADYEHWRKNLWQPLCNEFGIPCAAEACQIKPPLYKLRHHDADVKQASYVTWQKGAIDRMIIDVKNPRLCRIVERRELHAGGSDRSCLHVELEIPETMIYEAGDHVGLFAPNNSQLVEQAAVLLNVQLDSVVSVIPVAGGRPVIGPCPIRRVLSHFVELTSVPRKTFMIGVLQYTTDPDERARLEKLLADDDAYLHYTKTSHRSVLEVLTEYTSCKMPLEHFVELVAPMTPRYYSISSSPKEHPQRVHITAVLVQYQTPTGRLHDGVCTSWLSNLQPGTDMAPAFIRKSNFKLPRNPAIPIIMVGPGTGVAPFRGFIQDRKHWQRDKLGKSVLFFGCRNENVDFLYGDELKAAVSEGYLTALVTAFSRDQAQKVYVQHRIREHQELIWETMENNGYIFVCGDAKMMAKDVYETLRQIIIDLGGKTPEQAKQYLTSLQTSNRYLQDIWQ